MSTERATRPWPGWDGALLIVLAVLATGLYLGRGQLGGGDRLLVVLAVDALWLGATWWSRR
ncbi:MAG: hypothetical protein H6739_33410 [Alphaproteobacteria bacterium]|nr:hypothetical protein [Alphaproteobacteria bacterium]